jgi:hypothetical protein
MKKHDMIRGYLTTVKSDTSSVDLTSTAGVPIKNLTVYGNTKQDGIPSIDNPVDIVNMGDSGITVGNSKNVVTIPHTVTVNGKEIELNFGKITDGENVYSDTLEIGKGKVVYKQRVWKYSYNGDEYVAKPTTQTNSLTYRYNTANMPFFADNRFGLSNYLSFGKQSSNVPCITFGVNGNKFVYLMLLKEDFPDIDSVKAWFKLLYDNGNPLVVQTYSAEPIAEYDLSDTEFGKSLLELLQTDYDTNEIIEIKGDISSSKIECSYYSLESEEQNEI